MRTRWPSRAVAVLIGLALASCTASPPDRVTQSPSATLTHPVTGARTSPAKPRPSARAIPPSTQPTSLPPSDSTAARAREAQIPAASLPGLDGRWEWRRQSSGPGPGQVSPSICLRSSLTAIGAVAEYRTDFANPPTDTATAAQTTAVFPDAQTATTAADVIDTWRRTCATYASDSGYRTVLVGPEHSIATLVGTGHEWPVTFRSVSGDPTLSRFQAEGYVTDNDTMTYVVIRSTSRGYLPAGGSGSPIDRALTVAADLLAASRPVRGH